MYNLKEQYVRNVAKVIIKWPWYRMSIDMKESCSFQTFISLPTVVQSEYFNFKSEASAHK